MRHFLVLVIIALVALASPVQAKDFTDKYKDPNFKDMVEFLAQHKLLNLEDPATFSEYLRTAECEIYRNVSNSQFKQQELKQILQAKLQRSDVSTKELFIRVPLILYIEQYDFDTQSFAILADSQFKRVNILELFTGSANTCALASSSAIEKIPLRYTVKLNFPISLFRIPMRKDIAQTIFEKLDLKAEGYAARVIYGYIYVQVEAIQPEIVTDARFARAISRGQVNAIDLFADQNRRNLIKRLDYASVY